MKRMTVVSSAMKRSRPARWMLPFLVWAVALTLVGCDNDIEFNPAAPTFPNFPQFPNGTTAGPGRSLEIFGSLTAEQGSCFEATVLYDGRELAGARAECPERRGCQEMELNADARSNTGHHTIAFQVLSQSRQAIDYLAEGRVLMHRDGISMVRTIYLPPTRARLRPGETVTFEVDFQNFENE